MDTNSISLCMIVKNEERDLAGCLESAAGLVDEIIVVDTGSSDHTIEIARKAHAVVVEKNWPGDFSKARNFSLELAHMPWILVLDADEKLDANAVEPLKKILSKTTAAGLRLIQRNLYPPGELIRYHDIPITRVFRNHPDIRYEGMIHESVVEPISRIGAQIVNTSFVIWHSGYANVSVQGGGNRAERNLELLKKMVQENPTDSYVHYQLGITYKQLGNHSEAARYLKQVLTMNTSGLTPAIMSEILMKLAQIESTLKNDRACVQYAEESLRYDAENIVSMYLAGLCHISLGEINLAYPHFLKIRQAPVELLNDTAELDLILAYCRKVLENKK